MEKTLREAAEDAVHEPLLDRAREGPARSSAWRRSLMSCKKLLGIKGNETGKPSGLPGNWPNPGPEDIAALPNRVVKVGEEQDHYFSDNFVKTSKYEVYNFLPRFLMEEFNPKQKMANVYFLIVACLQTVPQITNTFGIPTTLMPLTFVVVVDAVFAILEDMARHRADEAANSSVTRRLNRETNTFEDCTWYECKSSRPSGML